MRMRPASGSERRAIIRSSVDLPHPEGPRIATNSPAAISRSKFSKTTCWLSKTRRTPFRSRATPPEGCILEGCMSAVLFHDGLGHRLVLIGVGHAHGNRSLAGTAIHLEAVIVLLGIGQAGGGLDHNPFPAV